MSLFCLKTLGKFVVAPLNSGHSKIEMFASKCALVSTNVFVNDSYHLPLNG